MDKTKRISSKWIFAAVVVIIAVCYCSVASLRSMPYSEGWYTYYAQLINGGSRVYRDFDYLFTPFYIYLIAFVTKVFGYRIIVLRIMGMIFYGTLALLLYLIFEEVFADWIAAVAALVAVLYLQSEEVQIYYDYVRLMDIFALLTVCLFIRILKNWDDSGRKQNIILFAAGITNSCFFLVKQNMGGVFFAYGFMFIVIFSVCSRSRFRDLVSRAMFFSLGFIVPVALTLVFMVATGTLVPFINCVTGSAIAAKGGITDILFGWMSVNADKFLNRTMLVLDLAFAGFLAAGYIFRDKDGSLKNRNRKAGTVIAAGFAVLLAALLAVSFESRGIAQFIYRDRRTSAYMYFMMILEIFLAAGVYIVINGIRGKKTEAKTAMIFFIAASYMVISWGCAMSSGLAEGQASLGIGLFVALLLDSMSGKLLFYVNIPVTVVCLFFTMQFALRKWFYPYTWHGITVESIWDNTEEFDDIDILKGIKVTPACKNVYESVYHSVVDNTDSNDAIYCFPHCPIFYTICGRGDPGVRAPVEWFDVVSDSSCANDIGVLAANPPSAIIMYNVPEGTYVGHEGLFRNGGVSGTRVIRDYLYQLTSEKNYTYLGDFVEGTDSISVWILEK